MQTSNALEPIVQRKQCTARNFMAGTQAVRCCGCRPPKSTRSNALPVFVVTGTLLGVLAVMLRLPSAGGAMPRHNEYADRFNGALQARFSVFGIPSVIDWDVIDQLFHQI